MTKNTSKCFVYDNPKEFLISNINNISLRNDIRLYIPIKTGEICVTHKSHHYS